MSFSTQNTENLKWYILVSYLPEIKEIKELVDKKLDKTETVDNLSKMALLFANVIQNSKEKFSDKTPQQIAQIIFASYQDRFFTWLQEDNEYQALASKISRLLSENVPGFPLKELNNSLETVIQSHMKSAHSFYIGMVFTKLYEEKMTFDLNK